MKRIKNIKGYSICQLTKKEMENRNMNSEYVLITKDEMEYVSSLRNVEWDADTIGELEEWLLST